MPEVGGKFLGVPERSATRSEPDSSTGGYDSAEDAGDGRGWQSAGRDARGSWGRRGGLRRGHAVGGEARPACLADWDILARRTVSYPRVIEVLQREDLSASVRRGSVATARGYYRSGRF